MLGVLLCENLQVAYQLDDLLVVAKSPEMAVDHTLLLIEYMGFPINWKKSAPWLLRQATFLGLRLDAVPMTATIKQE